VSPGQSPVAQRIACPIEAKVPSRSPNQRPRQSPFGTMRPNRAPHINQLTNVTATTKHALSPVTLFAAEYLIN
jgi:hypothetical protein